MDTLKSARTQASSPCSLIPLSGRKGWFSRNLHTQTLLLRYFSKASETHDVWLRGSFMSNFQPDSKLWEQAFFFPFLQLSSYYERLKIRFRQTLLDSQEIQNETINTASCSMDVLGTPNSSSRRKEGRTQLRVGWLCLLVILLLLLKQRISKVPDIEIP